MRKLSRICAYLSLSLLIHLGLSQLFAGSPMNRQTPRTFQVSLVSREASEKSVVAQQPKLKPEPRQKHEPVTEKEPLKIFDAVIKENRPSAGNAAPAPKENAPSVSSPASAASEALQGISAVDSATTENIYQTQILEIIRKNLKYPGNARRRGIEGTVIVRFTIHGSGRTGDIQVVNSSGAALLDKASLDTIRICSFPPPPRSSMTLSVPITFRLTGER